MIRRQTIDDANFEGCVLYMEPALYEDSATHPPDEQTLHLLRLLQRLLNRAELRSR